LWTNASSEAGTGTPSKVRVAHVSGRASSNTRRSTPQFRLGATSRALAGASVAIAPLAVGAAHKTSVVFFVSTCAASLLLLIAAGRTRGLGEPRFLAAPFAFLVLTLLQLLPIPASVLGWLDPAGAQLVVDNGIAPSMFRPFSLDPPSTLLSVAKFSACFAIFAVAAQTSSASKRRRDLFVKTVAISGVAALLVAIGHRIWGVTLIYGHFGGTRPLLNGPFVNPNHNAEFLELASFAALACALVPGPRFQRILWTAAAISCAAGALATLSRGSLLALAAGGGSFTLLMVLAQRQDPSGATREGSAGGLKGRIVWFITLVASLLLVAFSLGAISLLDRFTKGNLMGDVRIALWRDSFRVLRAHPLGIGAGAFDRVYPVYRTIVTDHAVRFGHVENQPLQWLIEYGWGSFALLVLAIFTTLGALAFRSMTPWSLAVCAGLIAVFVHNFVDFGIDLLGVSLPFAALAGTLAGRAQRPSPSGRSAKLTLIGALGVVAIATVSVPLLLAPPLRDFDDLIRKAATPAERRDLAIAAERAHPTDYFYALVRASATPLLPDAQGRFPRLRALNRALQLCTNCSDAHLELARSLWSLGRRKQSITEYRNANTIQPDRRLGVVDEIWRAGRQSADLKALAGPDASTLLEISAYLLDQGQSAPAAAVLAEAEVYGAPSGPVVVLRGRAALLGGDNRLAERLLRKAQSLLPTDSRIPAYLAEAMERNGETDQAVELLETLLARTPNDLDSARLRLSLLTRHKRWSQTEKALDALKEALQNNQMPTTEAHISAARVYLQQDRLRDALAEFQIASVQSPEDADLLVEYAQSAARAGQATRVSELLASVAAIRPGDPTLLQLRKQVEAQRQSVTRKSLLGVDPTGGPQ
jgi:tetratricopeptide (TPR) repeat protein